MRNKLLGTGSPGYAPIRKFKVCVSGFRYAVLYDFNVAYKLVLSVAAIAVFGYLHKWVDFMILLVATALLLVTEMFNTTTEALCNIIQPREDPRIKIIKDISAGAAGLCTAVWFIVLIAEIAQFVQAMQSTGNLD